MKIALSVISAVTLLVSNPASAQENAAQGSGLLNLELNAVQPSEKGCRLTFVVTNGMGTDLTRTAFEIVLFDKAGVVNRITALEFKELPAAKTKVSRFDLSGVNCDNLGRVLINSVTECAGVGMDAAACAGKLKAISKAGIEFGT